MAVTAPPRKFTSALAQRARVPLIIGIAGPSGTGKTKSGLRLADGMARLDKDRETFVVDTEAKRALHYAREHRFRHVEFPPPHGPADYLEVLNYCISCGAGRVLFDSASHEHDGEGGVLQMHAQELERMGGDMRRTFEAWALPKRQRRAFINRMVSSGVDIILCYRADEKKQPVRGKAPIDLGFVPVGGREYMFEMAIKLLLLPGARGVPTFRTNFPGEQRAIKIPGQFEALFARSAQLSEEIGEQMARWAGGGDAPIAQSGPRNLAELLTCLGACSDRDALDELTEESRALWKGFAAPDQKRLKAAIDGATTRVRMLEAQAAAAARAMADAADSTGDADGDAPQQDAEIPPPAEPGQAA